MAHFGRSDEWCLECDIRLLRKGVQTDWMEYGDLCPLPGDIIEFKRGVYHHVGISDGEYGIYHFSTDPTSIPDTGISPEIKVKVYKPQARFRHDKLLHVSKGCLMRINNSDDYVKLKTQDMSVSEIIQRCEDHVGKGYGTYNIMTNNCEHKATEMRYGAPSSVQIDAVKEFLGNLYTIIGLNV